MTPLLSPPFVSRVSSRADYKGEKWGRLMSFHVDDSAGQLVATCPDAERMALVRDALNRTVAAAQGHPKKDA